MTPFDTSTELGRTKERHRRALLTTLANALSRGIGLVALVQTLRIALPYLGPARFGVLATILSFASLLTFLDLGIGNALVGQVAHAVVRGPEELPRVVGRALWVLTPVGVVIGLGLCALSRLAPIASLFKGASPETLNEARDTLVAFSMLFGASVPLGAAQRVFQGRQRGYIVHLVSAALALAGLVLLHALTRVNASMYAFLFVGYGMQVLSGGVLLAVLAIDGGITGPRREYFSGPDTRALLKAGGMFLLLQVGTLVGWGSDTLIVSATLGPVAVVVFTLADRASQFISAPLYMFSIPLWASYSDAFARGERAYIRKTLRNSLAFTTAVAAAAAVALLASRNALFRFLTKDFVEVPSAFFAAYLGWVVLRAQGDCFGLYLTGVHALRPQLAVMGLYLALALPAKVISASTFGLASFAIVSICGYVLTVVLPYLTVLRRDVFRAVT